jgi:putative ATP-binding cassette transporter
MELKSLGDVFWKVSPNAFFLSIVLGVITGLCNALLIPFVMYAVNVDVESLVEKAQTSFSFLDSPTSELASAFLIVCALIVCLRGTATTLSTYVAMRATVEHRLWIYRRTQHISFATLEKIGQARLINLLNIDVPAITGAAVNLPQIWISIFTIIGVLGYLVHLNGKVFLFVLGCITLAIVTYQLPLILANRFFHRARDHYDKVQQGMIGLIHGAKELKLNSAKAAAFYQEELLSPEHASLRESIKGNGIFVFTQGYGDLLSFLIIGVVVFHFRYTFGLTPYELLGLVLALLYLTGPIATILNALGNVQRGRVSLEKMRAFYLEMDKEISENKTPIPSGWKKIKVQNLGYRYATGDRSFSIHGINLEFARGEITFIVGGNGSGKSTLGKCLSLLYMPTEGHISIDDEKIGSPNLGSAREMISAIFPDYYLFKKMYLPIDEESLRAIERYLKYLGLSEKVSVVDGQFSTIALSEGQRKRLAMLVMLMEDRDICIFDEWAADQDPEFKEVFYTTILSDLRARNKAIIVISHDDGYFYNADRIIKMESGAVVNIIDRKIAATQLMQAV